MAAMLLIVIVLVTVVCGVVLGMFSKVLVLFPGFAVILCAGGAHTVLYGDPLSLVPTVGALVSLQVGYLIGAVIEDKLLRPDSSRSQSITRVQ